MRTPDFSSALRDPSRLAALRRLAIVDTPTERAFDRLTSLATKFLGVPISLVTLVEEDRQFFKSCVGLPEPWSSSRSTPLSHSFCQHAVHLGEPLVINDAREHPLVRENLAIRDLNVIAYAGIPLITPNGHVLGSFCAIDTKPRSWTEEDIGTLSDLAASVMTELELRAATMELAERTERLSRLQAVTAELSGALTPARVAEVLLDEVLRSTRAVAGSVALLDQERRELDIVASRGYDVASVEAYRRFSLDAPLPMADAIRTGHPVYLRNRTEWMDRYPGTLGVQSTSDNQSSAALLLASDGRTFGAIGVSFKHEGDFRDVDQSYLVVLTRYCAQALERARLYTATVEAETAAEEARERLEFLLDASTSLASTLAYSAALQSLGQLAVPALADGCIIDVIPEQGGVERVVVVFADEGDQTAAEGLKACVPVLRSGHPIAQVMTDGEPRFGPMRGDIAWKTALAKEYELLVFGLGVTSYIAVPLQARQRIFGALTLVSTSTRHMYDSGDLSLIADLAGRAAIIIDNARLYEGSMKDRST